MGKNTEKNPFGRGEGNYIDKIIKENCEEMKTFIFEKFCGLEWNKVEPLPETKQQVTREREPDFLHIIYNDDFPKGAVIHIEFETSDNQKMCRRMLEYTGILHKKTKKPVLQYVIYLGKGKAKMKRKINWPRLDYSFVVIDIEDYSYKEFLNSEFPEGIIFSLMANHEGLSVNELTELIVRRLVKNKEDKNTNTKFINQLIMFARFRRLHEEVNSKNISMKETDYFDVNTDIFYLQGVEQGERRGEIKKGIKSIEVAMSLQLDDSITTKMSGFELDFVKKIKKQFLKKDRIIVELKKAGAEVETIAKKLKVHPLLVEVVQDEWKKKQQN